MEMRVVAVSETLELLHGSGNYFGKPSFFQEYKDPVN